MEAASLYHRQLHGWAGGRVPFASYRGSSAYHLMVVVLPDAAVRAHRAVLLREAGVQTSVHYPCIPDFEAFRRFDAPGLERSRSFAARVLTLPLFPHMLPSQVDEVCARLQADDAGR